MARKTRRELKEIFKAGAQPTGQDFHDLIDSNPNSTDDGLEKPEEPSLPIRIRANGTQQNLFDFYDEDQIHSWRINQYPKDLSVGGETPQRSGFNISDVNGDSRLFIKQDNGDTGIGTPNPQAKLHVVQRSSQGDSFRVDDMDDDSTPFIISGDGAVKIRVNPEDYDQKVSLDVKGPVRFVNTDGSLPSLTVLKGTDLDLDGKPDLTVDVDGDEIPDKPEAAFSVTENGAVGIGTDAPITGVTVKGDVRLENNLEIKGELFVRGSVFARDVEEIKNVRDVRLGDQDEDTLTINGEIASAHSTGSLCIYDSLNVKERVIIGSSYYGSETVKLGSAAPENGLLVEGRIGVGTSSPSAKLSVNGGVHIGGDSDPGNDNLHVDGKVTVDGKTGLGAEPVNMLDVEGAAVFGAGYAGTKSAPANGVLIEGNLGIGTSNTINQIDINGAAAIGAGYAGIKTAPADSLIVKGNVGIGIENPAEKLEVSGTVKATNMDASSAISGASLTVTGQMQSASIRIGANSVSQINTALNGASNAFPTDLAVKTYVDIKDADVKAYVDAKDNATRSYSDTKDNEVRSYVNTNVNNLNSSINAVSNSLSGYASTGHSHSYAASNHSHAVGSHSHDYASSSHSHSGYATTSYVDSKVASGGGGSVDGVYKVSSPASGSADSGSSAGSASTYAGSQRSQAHIGFENSGDLFNISITSDGNLWFGANSDSYRSGDCLMLMNDDTEKIGIKTTAPGYTLHVNGNAFAKKLYVSDQDYAEYFESVDSNEIPPGTSVFLDNGKVRPAQDGETPLGIISATPSITGGVYPEWPGKYLKDDFGRVITDTVTKEKKIAKIITVTKERQKTVTKTVKEQETRSELVLENGKYCRKEITEEVEKEIIELVFEEVDVYDETFTNIIGKEKIPVMETYEVEEGVFDEDGNRVMVGSGKFITEEVPRINPDYDPLIEYIKREDRPEWNCVGLLGQIILKKGQPVSPNWVKIKDVSDSLEVWLVK